MLLCDLSQLSQAARPSFWIKRPGEQHGRRVARGRLRYPAFSAGITRPADTFALIRSSSGRSTYPRHGDS